MNPKKVILAITLRSIGALSAFLMSLVITRTCGINEAGLFFICLALVTTLSTAARTGTDNALTKFTAISWGTPDAGKSRQLLSAALQRTSLLSAGTGATLLAFAPEIATGLFDKPELATPLRVAAIAVLLHPLIFVYASTLHGRGEVERAIFLKNVAIPLLISCLLLGWQLSGGQAPSASGLAATMAVALLLTITICAVRESAAILPAQTLPTTGEIRSFWRQARTFYGTSLMEMSTLWANQLICGIFLSASGVAIFSTAQRASMAAVFVLMAIGAAVTPRFARLHAQGEHQKLRRLAQLSTLLTAAIAAPIFLIGTLFASEVMSLFGENFAQGGLVFSIMLAGQLFNGATGPASQLLLMTGHERDVRLLTLISGGLNIILTTAGTIAAGIEGAASALAATVILHNLALLVLVRKRLGFWTLSMPTSSR